MASVSKAFQPALDRVVALKVMRADLATDAEFVARFRREAKAISRLRHPHIVDVFDFDEEGGRHFLAMEYPAQLRPSGVHVIDRKAADVACPDRSGVAP